MICGSGSGSSRLDVSNCLISVPAGVGVWVYDDYADIHNITVDNVGTGFVCTNDVNPTIERCIVTDYADGSEYAYESVNAVYCIGDGNAPYDTGTQGTGSVIQEPLYCNESTKEYTLRVDSYGNPGNNASDELIGAYPVACMFGTLARTSEFKGNGTLYVPADVVIPSQKTLTLDEATTLKIRKPDSLSIVSDPNKVELVVSSGGTLNLLGAVGSEVVLTSNDESPAEGDWWGIKVNSGGTANIEYATITYSDYGIRYLSTTSGHISYSTFSDNAISDITAAVGDGSMGLTIDHNLVAVGGGKGIELSTDVSGLSITSNSIVGDEEDSYSGIFMGTFFAGQGTPFIGGNFIQTITSGYGIYAATAAPQVEQNEIQFCGYGVQTTGGTAFIGDAAESDSDNIIHQNFTGVRVDGGTAKLRYNQITDNWYGVVNRNTGDVDLGTSFSDKGYNTLTGNSSYCIDNDNSSVTVRAQGNYFGTCNPSPPTCWSGSVDTAYPLCSPPAGVDWTIEQVPTRFVLHGLSPNPMRGAGLITFSLPEASDKVEVRILDLGGRVVRDFGRLAAGPGRKEVAWDGRDKQGVAVVSGIYFIQVQAGNHKSEAVKALVVR